MKKELEENSVQLEEAITEERIEKFDQHIEVHVRFSIYDRVRLSEEELEYHTTNIVQNENEVSVYWKKDGDTVGEFKDIEDQHEFVLELLKKAEKVEYDKAAFAKELLPRNR